MPDAKVNIEEVEMTIAKNTGDQRESQFISLKLRADISEKEAAELAKSIAEAVAGLVEISIIARKKVLYKHAG